MTEWLNNSKTVAAITVIAKVPSVHERAISLALLEGFGSPSAKPLPQINSWTQVELCHLEHIVA